jgi:hypothetical protein
VIRQVDLAQDYRGVTVAAPTADGRLVFDSRGLLVSPTSGPLMVRAQGQADSALVTAGGRVYRDY